MPPSQIHHCAWCGRALHDGTASVLLAFDADELEAMAREAIRVEVRDRAIAAIRLIDQARADALFAELVA